MLPGGGQDFWLAGVVVAGEHVRNPVCTEEAEIASAKWNASLLPREVVKRRRDERSGACEAHRFRFRRVQESGWMARVDIVQPSLLCRQDGGDECHKPLRPECGHIAPKALDDGE